MMMAPLPVAMAISTMWLACSVVARSSSMPHGAIYWSFSNRQHQPSRCDDEPWYRYAFSDTDFAVTVQNLRRPISTRGTGQTDRIRNCLAARHFRAMLPADMTKVTRVGALRPTTPREIVVSLVTNAR